MSSKKTSTQLSRLSAREQLTPWVDLVHHNLAPVWGELESRLLIAHADARRQNIYFRSFFQEDLDRVKAYHETEAYQKAMRKRALWTEPLFGEAKQYHRLTRFRLRGLLKVNIDGVLVAAGQNLKRLLKFLSLQHGSSRLGGEHAVA